MTAQGGQYPDGPLEPPPAWFSDEALRKRAAAVPGIEEQAWANLGALMGNLLSPPSEPGPPWVHTLIPPRPCPTGCDEDCELNPGGCHEWHQPTWKRDHDPDECEALQRPGPAGGLTLTQRPVADVAAGAGFGPVPPRIEITADFCQCPACREARYET